MKIVLYFWLVLVFSPLVHRVSVVREKWKTDHYMPTLTCHSAGLTTAMCPTHFARLLLITLGNMHQGQEVDFPML